MFFFYSFFYSTKFEAGLICTLWCHSVPQWDFIFFHLYENPNFECKFYANSKPVGKEIDSKSIIKKRIILPVLWIINFFLLIVKINQEKKHKTIYFDHQTRKTLAFSIIMNNGNQKARESPSHLFSCHPISKPYMHEKLSEFIYDMIICWEHKYQISSSWQVWIEMYNFTYSLQARDDLLIPFFSHCLRSFLNAPWFKKEVH